MSKKKHIAFIPARRGSKGVPLKNRLLFDATADFLEKATWGLAIALLVLSVMGSAFIQRGVEGAGQSRVQEQIETAVDPTQVPRFPTTPPPAATEETPAATDGGNQ